MAPEEGFSPPNCCDELRGIWLGSFWDEGFGGAGIDSIGSKSKSGSESKSFSLKP